MTALWIIVAAFSGFMAVLAGALGSHMLEPFASGADRTAFRAAVDYQMWHALALFGVAWLSTQSEAGRGYFVTLAGAAFTVGIVLFSGSLYMVGVFASRALVALAPIGGSAFLVGWLALVFAGCRYMSKR